jgi:dUTP pyrophosphatase
MSTPLAVKIAFAPDRPPGLATPSYAREHDAGLDLPSMETFELEPGEWRAVRTGLHLEIPPGFEAQIRPRSGLASGHGVTVLNAPSTIDAGYRGEVKVILINLSRTRVLFTAGMKIAQLVFAPVVRADLQVATLDTLSPSERGTGGFGSSGR